MRVPQWLRSWAPAHLPEIDRELEGLRNIINSEVQGAYRDLLYDSNRLFFGGLTSRERIHMAEMERERKRHGLVVCNLNGHKWGPVKRDGGTCFSCRGDGMDHDLDYGSEPWTDCGYCHGLGYIETTYTRTCERCGEIDTRRPLVRSADSPVDFPAVS